MMQQMEHLNEKCAACLIPNRITIWVEKKTEHYEKIQEIIGFLDLDCEVLWINKLISAGRISKKNLEHMNKFIGNDLYPKMYVGTHLVGHYQKIIDCINNN